MGTGQMMITVGAMILLGMIVLNVNRGFLLNSTVIMETKFNVLAISLATSVIEDANGLSFDEKTIGGITVTAETQLSTLGKEIGEYYYTRDSNNFNDFDDYHGTSITYNDTTLRSAVYTIDCEVGYITDLNPDSFTSLKTWYKRLNVKVSSVSMADTIKMSTVMSYFYFR